jgi:Domain of unknown function (DUF5615)
MHGRSTVKLPRTNQGIEDDAVLRYATDNDRCLITINRRDFMRLHRAVPIHGGIIVCTENRAYAAFARRIDLEISRVPALANQLLRVVRGEPGN